MPSAVRRARSGSPSTSSRASEPQITTATRVERAQGAAEAALGEAGGKQQDAQAGAAQEELQRLHVDGLDAERRAGVEQQHALVRGSRRRPGGGRDAASRWPSGTRTRARRRRSGAPLGELERRQQELGDACARPSAPRGSPRARGRRRPRRSGRRRRPAGRGRRGRGRAGGRPRPRSRCCGSRAAPRAAPRPRRARRGGGCPACGAGGGSRGGAPSCAGCWC